MFVRLAPRVCAVARPSACHLARCWVPRMPVSRFFATEIVKIPRMGESIVDGTVATLQKNVGDYVNQDDIICVLETSKVSVDVRSPFAGRLEALTVKVGDTIAVDAELAKIDTSAAPGTGASPKPVAASAPAAGAAATPSATPTATPSAATAAPGASPTHPHPWQGARARTPEEAKAIPVVPSAPAPSAPAPKAAAAPAPGAPAPRGERRVKMTRMRMTIADRLKKSQNTLALLTTFNEVDMTNITSIRNKFKDEFNEKHKVKLGFMSAFVKASTAALQAFPDVNASIEGDHIVYHDYIDISVAVASPTGLVVPVLRNTEHMSFADIERQIALFGQKAKKKELAMEDMMGGTFTISNGGVFGSMMGTPIVNPPQSAILGMHGVSKRAVVIKDQIVIRSMMYLALTYDHRLIDGATAVSFLKKIKTTIEEPSRLLLDI